MATSTMSADCRRCSGFTFNNGDGEVVCVICGHRVYLPAKEQARLAVWEDEISYTDAQHRLGDRRNLRICVSRNYGSPRFGSHIWTARCPHDGKPLKKSGKTILTKDGVFQNGRMACANNHLICLRVNDEGRLTWD